MVAGATDKKLTIPTNRPLTFGGLYVMVPLEWLEQRRETPPDAAMDELHAFARTSYPHYE